MKISASPVWMWDRETELWWNCLLYTYLGMDFAMHGMCVFSPGERAGYPMFYRNAEKKLAREQRKLSRCEKGSRNYQKQKKKVALYLSLIHIYKQGKDVLKETGYWN